MKIVDPKFRIDDYEFRRLSVLKFKGFWGYYICVKNRMFQVKNIFIL